MATKYHESAQGVVANLGGLPLIWMIPTINSNEVDQSNVTIKLPKKAKETYNKFKGGTPEKAIHHIRTFHNLGLKLKC